MILFSVPLTFAALEYVETFVAELTEGFPLHGSALPWFQQANWWAAKGLLLLLGFFAAIVLVEYLTRFLQLKAGAKVSFAIQSLLLRKEAAFDGKANQAITGLVISAEGQSIASFATRAFYELIYQAGIFVTVLVYLLVQEAYEYLAVPPLLLIQFFILRAIAKRYRIRLLRQILASRMLSAETAILSGSKKPVTSEKGAAFRRAKSLFHIRVRMAFYQALFYAFQYALPNVVTFLVLLIGAVLYISGDLSISLLAAAMAGSKDLIAPSKQLSGYYFKLIDAGARYELLRRWLVTPRRKLPAVT